jgi:DNA-binding response OmpR family regulator
MRILLVEDDTLLGDGLQATLRQAGYTVDWVRDGRDAKHAALSEPYAAIVLDLGLPGMDGLAVLRGLRDAHSAVPVLILTARDTVTDRVKGLDSGADDYLVKPFDTTELQARIRALIRRAGGRGLPVLRHGPVTLDPAAHAVTLHGEPVALTAREFAVLQELLENRGRVLSRTQLEQSLLGWDEELSSNAMEVHIHNLRRKLGDEVIKTVRGVGYMIPAQG